MKPNFIQRQNQRHRVNTEANSTRARKDPVCVELDLARRGRRFAEAARADGVGAPKPSARSGRRARLPAPANATMLLVSDDTSFYWNLRRVANMLGRMVVRADGAGGALPILYASRPAAVLLDLDLPEQAAWEAADTFLCEQKCPPVILLTGRGEQFDLGTAIRAGCLVDKSAGPARLLEVVDETLAMPDSSRAERHALQRVLVRWLRPCGWSVPITPAQPYWGITE